MSLPNIPIAKPLIGAEEQKAVADVLASGMLASGPRVAEFEAAFAKYVGVKHAIATSNATTGLHACLIGLGVKPGDEVILPAFTFIATANTVLFAGAKPVFVDIDPVTFNIDPGAVRKAITPKTSAVMPVHLFGQPADIQAIAEATRGHDIKILGDAAQAHGAAIGPRKVGSFGDVECFSMYPTKNMTTGEGGMITTDDAETAERIRSFVNHGRAKSELGTYDHVRIGHNFRLTDIGAAIGIEQLKKLDGWNQKRAQNAATLTEGLTRAPHVSVPHARPGITHVFHQYTIRVPERESFLVKLKAKGVGHGIYYPKPLHHYPHLTGFARHAVPHAEQAAREVVSLPVHPALSTEDLHRIVEACGGKVP